ncbi:hypothetical protein I79_000235 [Cricetulus griseus]|uniref:Secreted protein n=1 Tax=Cricetulus griseus TaxID=10029 RepID=G3GRU1_CRIGR|nr:hypothetical protein I79_000235 [Cricetulus griseus]
MRAELAQQLLPMRLFHLLCQLLRLGSVDLCAMTIFLMEPSRVDWASCLGSLLVLCPANPMHRFSPFCPALEMQNTPWPG